MITLLARKERKRNIKELPPSGRIYACERCKMKMDRDVNAARNIPKRATAGPMGSYTSGDIATTVQECAASSIYEPGTTYGRAQLGPMPLDVGGIHG
jgi:hypothetical protein